MRRRLQGEEQREGERYPCLADYIPSTHTASSLGDLISRDSQEQIDDR